MRTELVTDLHAPLSSPGLPDFFGEEEPAPESEPDRQGRKPPTREYEAMVTDACVTAHIKKLLGAWIEGEHHDDLLQQVRLRLLVCGDPPPTMDRMLRLATTITRGRVIDLYRRHDVRQGREIPYEEQEHRDGEDDAHRSAQQEQIARAAKEGHLTDASDEVYAKERAQFVETQIAEGTVAREDVEIAVRTGTGETTYEEEAREQGTTPENLRVRVHRVRTLLRTRFAKLTAGSLGVLLLLWLLMTILAALFGGVTRPAPSNPEPGGAPTVLPSPPAPSHR